MKFQDDSFFSSFLEYNSYMNKTQRVVIIRSNSLAFLPNAKEVYLCYHSYCLFARILRKLLKKLRLRCAVPFFYGKWKREIKGCSVVIIFDGGIDDVNLITKYIKKVNPGLRLVFWYWNPVKEKDVALNNKFIDEIWTYSRFDAKKYNLKYNPQFYNKMTGIKSSGKKTDLVFMGTDKGRRKSLECLKRSAESQSLKCNFRIVDSKRKRVSYIDYLSTIMGAKCIVDIAPNQTCGLTLRPMEALFYGRKLVTNYQDIVNYDFYNSENVFVIGRDNIDKLAVFINSAYKPIDEKTIDYYRYENWLKRIVNNKDVVI